MENECLPDLSGVEFLQLLLHESSCEGSLRV